MQRLLLIDGSGYIFRAYHALPPLSRSDGTPVGAVLGFCNMLNKLLDSYPSDAIAVVFDAARVNFRNDLYAEYKANRSATPDDLIPQFPLIRDAAAAFNLPQMELEGFEADDIIASYAKEAQAKGVELIIVSSDKDLMQLIGPGVCMFDPMKNKMLSNAEVFEKFGVTPDKVVEVQALIGDSVDNIPGVPGIGPKTAAELINQYGTVENLLAHTHEIKQQKRREMLIEHAGAARMSRQLVELRCDVPLPIALEELARKGIDGPTLCEFFEVQQFKSLVTKTRQRFGLADAAPVIAPTPNNLPAPTRDYKLIDSLPELEAVLDKALATGTLAVACQTDLMGGNNEIIVGIGLAVAPGQAWYLPLNHTGLADGSNAPQQDLFGSEQLVPQRKRLQGQLEWANIRDRLTLVFNDPAVIKIGHNVKNELSALAKAGVSLAPMDDIMLISYVTAGGLYAHHLSDFAERHLGAKSQSLKDICGSGKTLISFDQVTLDCALNYAAESADLTLQLYYTTRRIMVESKVARVYEEIERPLIAVVSAMERRGIAVDPKRLAELSVEFATDLARLEEEIYALAGRAFTIGSPKQLGEVLYDEMGMATGKKSSKTGAYSTDAQVLEDLAAAGHVMPQKVLEWRGISKLKSTYSDALVKQIHPVTKRIHTTFSLAATTTGRLSSTDPNLQNIPIRTESGKRIREAFIAEPNNLLISADYSQIELRLLAHMAEIETLKTAFHEGRDIHAATASQMFNLPIDSINADLRRKAKTINFGIIYGISAHGLATRLGIGRSEAGDYINAYFLQYPGIRAYMESAKNFAREHGYVETLYGRRVHVKDINAKNPNLRAFSERAAINAPLQGTAADIIKRAMVDVHALLLTRYPSAHLCLQVHDELIVEAPAAQAEEIAAEMKRVMSRAAHLSVPLLVEAGIGKHWGEIH